MPDLSGVRISGVLMRTILTIVLAAAGLALAGCAAGGSTGGSAGDPAAAREPAVPRLAVADRPGEPPREPTPAELRLLHDAEQVALRDCMKRHGFTTYPVPYAPVPEAKDFPYALDDLAWARRHGYGTDLEQRARQLKGASPNGRYFKSLPAPKRQQAVLALNGDRTPELRATLPGGGVVARSDDGCTSESERVVYKDLRTWYQAKRVAQALANQRREKVGTDPAFVAGVARWATCLRAAGYPYKTPADARAAGGMAHKPLARAAEIRLAVADATCVEQTGLGRTARELDARYGSEIATSNRDVTAYRRLALDALPRARTIVARG